MGTISERKRKNGSKSYTAQIRIKRDGEVIYTEAQTFDRRPAAGAWLKKRETELAEPGALDALKKEKHILAEVINRYIKENEKALGRTKSQVLDKIKTFSIANMKCEDIKSEDIVSFARELLVGRKPQTVLNYISHLSTIFTLARPAWGVPLNKTAMDDAQIVLSRLGVTSKSHSRNRRPTRAELEKLLEHYTDRQTRYPPMLTMVPLILFGLFSTRRQEEITRLRWDDLEVENSRVLVRDMKNPGEKMGNHTWCDLPHPALAIALSMPKKGEFIFPFNGRSVSASFTRATALLGIDDLHFHDLRHEGITRLFEMGLTIPHVAAVSGHRSWTSLKRYSHIRQSGDIYAGWKWIKGYTAPNAEAKIEEEHQQT
ncbi:tyrosine-type recombinase/integrase [Agrobacterium sp. AGB01]|uniref:tyrosine-type recombinase/integrase n=1 Tax=Agrobacterium sp. AGB01 TaxID=2769302 RepID=UPI0017874C22|nr:tyrosine-type recombinase/integrase [Agrobacterium sp. AGB01]MBD9390106.1 tyrosine-type recombinase/integrase [Agrobacterium sp. AGB01]